MLLLLLPVASAFTFTSAPAQDLQPFFGIQVPWLGADVATSVRIGNSSTYLWLHGDTLLGSMRSGVRQWTGGMPRNSVATLSVSGAGAPTSPYVHAITPPNASFPQHGGFWSPPAASQWWWPTVGVNLGDGDVHIVAMRMEAAGSGLFPFATAGMDVLSFTAPGADPAAWPPPTPSSLPGVNTTFVLGCAAGVGADGFVYMLGSNNGSAMMARIPAASFSAHAWGDVLFFSGGSWAPLGGAPPDSLFGYVPSETTLVYHEFLNLWYIVWVNTFLSSAVMFRTAPHPWGPWSEGVSVYEIPPSLLDNAFCYAGKAHPELSRPGAPEVVFSFVCNTPNINQLLNRTEVYVPRLIRTTISA